MEELAGLLDAVNTADAPERIVLGQSRWQHGLQEGEGTYRFPSRSVTAIRLE